MPIVSLYAGLLGLLFAALSYRTLRMRRRLRIAIGDGGNQAMTRAMRVHSNFAEYVPLSLLLIYFAELGGASPVFIHALGISLLLGRIAHAIGVSRIDERFKYRVIGMFLTLTPMIAAALRLVLGFFKTNS